MVKETEGGGGGKLLLLIYSIVSTYGRNMSRVSVEKNLPSPRNFLDTAENKRFGNLPWVIFVRKKNDSPRKQYDNFPLVN